MGTKRQLPEFLTGVVTAEQYARWLDRKAAAHVRRDRKRDFESAGAAYRDAIHQAVIASKGKDATPAKTFTGRF